MRFFVVIGAALGTLILIAGIFGSNGAPQEAAMAAMACAFAIIPYVVFRAQQLTDAQKRREEMHRELLDRLDKLSGRE